MDKQITPWGEIGYITFKRTYARKLKNGKTEEFSQVVDRELNAVEKQLKLTLTPEEKKYYRKSRLELKWSVAGRFMWQLGTKTVDKLGLPSLQNCANVVVDSPIRPFTWAFEMLMLGSGVGYNIQNENVSKLPKIKKKVKIERVDNASADFIIPDTREGWVKLLGKVLKAHFLSGKGFTYSTQLIRSKGAPIKSFGGEASGPEELCWGIEQISKILNDLSMQKIRPIHCLDIMNIIGFIVVSGNVRRSAQIAIGDPSDVEFLQAKRWDLGSIPNWRAMSNNSVACDDINDLPSEFWDTYAQGEPYGLINLRLSRLIGRTGETQYPDPNVTGYNPCAEQSLENFETCCLAMVYLPNIKTYQEFIKCLKMAYRVCKHSLALHCSLEETENVVHKNMRMGIGVPGYLQASEEQKNWLSDAYKWLREYDNVYSAENNFPISIKLTTSKPDGTNALLPGLSPGCLPNPAGPYYIRRVRMASSSELVNVCRQHGYHIESLRNFDGSVDPNTVVVSFPCKVGENVPVASKFSWKEQIEVIRRVQSEWSDNSVSCTITYNKEDLEDIKKYLKENYKDNFKTLSFLLYQGHGFDQAPYEDITEKEYNKMVVKTTPITSINNISESEMEEGLDCNTGACPIK